MKTEAAGEYFEDDLKPSREYLEDGEDEDHLQEECTNFQKDLRDFISNMRTKSDCGKIGGPSQSVSAEIEAGSLMGEYGSFLGECKDCVDLQKTLRQIEISYEDEKAYRRSLWRKYKRLLQDFDKQKELAESDMRKMKDLKKKVEKISKAKQDILKLYADLS